MNQHEDRVNKITTVSLLFGTQLFAYMIRYALSIVAPTLMTLYNLSPKTMGYILSGWNWSYTAGLPILGPVVDRFGARMGRGLGPVVWGGSTIARRLRTPATSL